MAGVEAPVTSHPLPGVLALRLLACTKAYTRGLQPLLTFWQNHAQKPPEQCSQVLLLVQCLSQSDVLTFLLASATTANIPAGPDRTSQHMEGSRGRSAPKSPQQHALEPAVQQPSAKLAHASHSLPPLPTSDHTRALRKAASSPHRQKQLSISQHKAGQGHPAIVTDLVPGTSQSRLLTHLHAVVMSVSCEKQMQPYKLSQLPGPYTYMLWVCIAHEQVSSS